MIYLFVALGVVVFGFLFALFFAFLPSGALGHLERQVKDRQSPTAKPDDGTPPAAG